MGWEWADKECEETFWVDGNILNLDTGLGYIYVWHLERISNV